MCYTLYLRVLLLLSLLFSHFALLVSLFRSGSRWFTVSSFCVALRSVISCMSRLVYMSSVFEYDDHDLISLYPLACAPMRFAQALTVY